MDLGSTLPQNTSDDLTIDGSSARVGGLDSNTYNGTDTTDLNFGSKNQISVTNDQTTNVFVDGTSGNEEFIIVRITMSATSTIALRAISLPDFI